jgi:MFS family permease
MPTEKIFTREFILSSFAQFAFSSVFFLLIPTIPIYLSRKGATDVEIGLLVGILSVSSLALRPFIGKALLKIPEKNFMLAGAGLFVCTSIAYIVAPPFWPLLIVRLLQGVGLAFFATASFTLIANISPDAHRGKSLSYFSLAINTSFAVAPSIGVFLINQFDFTVLFLVCTGLSLCTLFITAKLEKREIDPMADSSVRDQPFLSREALPPAVMAFMTNVIWGAVTTFFPLHALSHGVTNPGLFFAAFAIMLILSRGLGGKVFDLCSREKLIFPSLFAYIIAMPILAFSKTLPMFILVAVIWGVGNAFLYPSLIAYAIDRAGPSRGHAMATFQAVADFGAGIGPVIMGIVLHWTSYPIMFLSLTLVSGINLCYFYFLVRKEGGGSHAHL